MITHFTIGRDKGDGCTALQQAIAKAPEEQTAAAALKQAKPLEKALHQAAAVATKVLKEKRRKNEQRRRNEESSEGNATNMVLPETAMARNHHGHLLSLKTQKSPPKPPNMHARKVPRTPRFAESSEPHDVWDHRNIPLLTCTCT